MEPTTLSAEIPVPVAVRKIAAALRPAEVYVVGGAVRDWLYWFYRTDRTAAFRPKDTDLATNLSEAEILARLRGADGVTVKEKESVDTFGVVFASFRGSETVEVAPFRKDVGGADGRHPDRVERGTIADDAARRDLTINSLYYDFDRKVVLDYNPGGAGIEDVKAGRVRTVGDPAARFAEDKLRILRMVRFFSRYNPGLIAAWLDGPTLAAVEEYRRLRLYPGMSPERIQAEFLLGLAQSQNTTAYLRNYADLGLLDAVFDVYPYDRWAAVGNTKNPRVVLAALLADGVDVLAALNDLKYPNDLAAPAHFLHRAMRFDPADVVDLLKFRDRRLNKSTKRPLTAAEEATNRVVRAETAQDIADLIAVTADPARVSLLEHLAGFDHAPTSGEELMKRGYAGARIGHQQRAEVQAAYTGSLKWWNAERAGRRMAAEGS